MEKLFDRLFSDKVDIITRTISGFIVFFISDIIMGGLLKLTFFINGDIAVLNKVLGREVPFGVCYITGILYKTLRKFGFSEHELIIIVYVLLWGWGNIVYHLRQVLILDKIKSNYLENFLFSESKKSDMLSLFEEVKAFLIRILRADKVYREVLSELESAKEGKNDYFLYILLSKDSNNIFVSKAKDADEIAFIGTNAILILIVCFVIYSFLYLDVLYYPDLLKKYGLFNIIAFLLWSLFSISISLYFIGSIIEKVTRLKLLLSFLTIVPFLDFFLFKSFKKNLFSGLTVLPVVFTISVIVIQAKTLEAVTLRLISRNIRLYINYIIDAKSRENLNKISKEEEKHEISLFKRFWNRLFVRRYV